MLYTPGCSVKVRVDVRDNTLTLAGFVFMRYTEGGAGGSVQDTRTELAAVCSATTAEAALPG